MSGSSLRKFALVASAAALLSTTSACYKGPQPEVGPVVTEPVVALGQDDYKVYPSDTYTLRPNDVINVSVFREAELSLNTVPISATGEISFPLLGPVQVAGLTATQLEAQLEQMLNARYLRYPDVTVNVVQYGSHLVTVEGSVNAPGLYNFSPGTRLSGAMALANGVSRIADQSEVAVFRQTSDGMAIAKFDYLAVQSGTMMDPELQPGDRIVVGLNYLSQYWQDALMALPVFAWFRRF